MIRAEHKTHALKCEPTYFELVRIGAKPFELRRNDRRFRVGDVLVLREWRKGVGYSGRALTVTVTYVLHPPRDPHGPLAGALGEEWVVLGFLPPQPPAPDPVRALEGELRTRQALLARLRLDTRSVDTALAWIRNHLKGGH